MSRYLKIAQLSKLCGLSVAAIRFYEEEGLIDKASRTLGNQRLYEESTVDKLRFLQSCRSIGMPLQCIERISNFCQGRSEEDLSGFIEKLNEYLDQVTLMQQNLDKIKNFLTMIKSKAVSQEQKP